jgi:hypothetical protein
MAKQPGHPRRAEPAWSFPPDVPMLDHLETYDLDDPGSLEGLIEDLIHVLERREFQLWEAVVREEQGLPLTEAQRAMLGRLLSFSDDPRESRILYIDDLPRPCEPWHVTFRKVVPHLVVDTFRTFDVHYAVTTEGWPRLAEALEEHGEGLSLPEGAGRPVEVIPEDLRHRLWLQSCFDHLSGLGQVEELTLQNEDQLWRIDEFIDALRRHRESLAYLGVTLDSLLQVLVLPEADLPLLLRLMHERVGVSPSDPLAEHLPPPCR